MDLIEALTTRRLEWLEARGGAADGFPMVAASQ